MKLAVSNIAWPTAQDAAVADVLTGLGVTGIEVAPTKVWPNLLDATPAEIDTYRRFWNDRGVEIVAAQALLFGRPELTLFDAPEKTARTLDYLARVIDLCARLGAGALVFGAPKNRRVGDRSRQEAWDIAVAFFGALAGTAARAGTCVVLEANPPEYGADFVTRTAEAIELIAAVDQPGFRLHLDTGCMTLAADPVRATVAAASRFLRHVHISEPNLDPPGTSGKVDHATFAGELHRLDYSGWVSLEMREGGPFVLDRLATAVQFMRERYAGATVTMPASRG